jgi:N-carbamoyl-L-amino-acid hydrolase
MAIRTERIEQDLAALAAIGASGPGAVTRLALTPADRAARRWLIERCRALGMAVRIDRFGNLAGVLGRWDRPALLVGSHLDSVPSGGRFDGVAGVITALEAVRSLQEEGRLPAFPVGVVNWTAEESTRWGVATMGSKGLSGARPATELLGLRDRDGITFAEALAANAGYDLVGAPTAAFDPGAQVARSGGPHDFGPIGGFLELHVEQGPELWESGDRLGIVSRIAAPTRFRVALQGEANHSGTTLMGRRNDALTAAAELILGVEAIGRAEPDLTVATATIFKVEPVSINVIPGRVELGIDLRSVDPAAKERAVAAFHSLIHDLQQNRSPLTATVELLGDEAPVVLGEQAVTALTEACRTLGLPFRPMVSRAGHDAMYLARVAPTAMLFVPSREGISHNPAEFTETADLALGAQVLAEAICRFPLA